MASCSHLDTIEVQVVPTDLAGYQEFLRDGTSHPVVRSAEPGVEWSWCYVDEVMFQLA